MKAMRYIMTLLLLFSVCATGAAAEEAYTGYNYDAWGDSVYAPNAYSVKTTLKATDVGIAAFSSPTDMVISGEKLYILDSGNNKIVIVNNQYQVLQSFHLMDHQGMVQDITGAQGIFVKDTQLLVADTKGARVLLTDLDGTIQKIFNAPPEGTLPSGVTYKPKKVLLDDLSNLYVLSDGCYMGALVFNNDGSYDGYFGANTVQLSVPQQIQRFWRSLMTDTQKSYTAQYVPIEYQSFDIDGKSFIYTCGLSDSKLSTSVNEIKKLNALGENILLSGTEDSLRQKNNYGDVEQQWEAGTLIDTRFVDIDVSWDGFIQALDSQRGRVFVYDQDNNLLGVFGGIGSQEGLFSAPVAVESFGNHILVLDKENNSLTVFEPNAYGLLIEQATIEQNNGQFEEALATWKEALKYNANSELANSGAGRMLLQMEQYREAMVYLKNGQDRAGYSKAYRFYRAEMMTTYFPFIALAIFVLLAFGLSGQKVKAAYYKKTGKQPCPKQLYVSHTLSHPLDFFEELFYNRSRRAYIGSCVMVLSLILVTIVQRQATGFIFNTNKLADFNIVYILLSSLGLMLLLTLSNWMVSTLLWGEGNLKQIWEGNGYALLPYILSVFVTVLLSNVIVSEEASILSLILSIGMLYTAFLLFTSVRVMHRYSISKAIVACLLIVLVSMLMLFLIVLVLSLLQQFYVFIMSIVNEITFRL